MEAKKVTITCKNCGQQMDVDFNTAHFSSEIQIMNGKKRQKRTYAFPRSSRLSTYPLKYTEVPDVSPTAVVRHAKLASTPSKIPPKLNAFDAIFETRTA